MLSDNKKSSLKKPTRTPRKKIPPTLDMTGIRHSSTGYKIERMYKGLRKSATTQTLEEALLKRQEIDTELRNRQQNIPEPPLALEVKKSWSLEQAAEVTFRHYWRGTADVDKQKIRTSHLVQFFGTDCLITTINTDKILAFREWAAKALGNGENTINKKVCCLSKILRTAFEHDKLDKLPKIPLVKVTNSRLRFMTPEEEEKTIASFRLLASHAHLDAFIVLIDTGFRLGELWTLTSAHINPLQGTVSLWNGETKNGWGRTIHMTTRVAGILSERRKKYPTGCLWPEKNNFWFQYKWNKVRAALGKTKDPEWVPHMLRHTCCSRLVQAGVDLFLVQRWMGHKSLSITQRYAHHGANHLKIAGAALENLITHSQRQVAIG